MFSYGYREPKERICLLEARFRNIRPQETTRQSQAVGTFGQFDERWCARLPRENLELDDDCVLKKW